MPLVSCTVCGVEVALADPCTVEWFTCPQCGRPNHIPRVVPQPPAIAPYQPAPPNPVYVPFPVPVPEPATRHDYDLPRRSVVEHHTHDHTPRRSAFGTAFGMSSGCLLGVISVVMGGFVLMVLSCAGCITLGVQGARNAKEPQVESAKNEPHPGKEPPSTVANRPQGKHVATTDSPLNESIEKPKETVATAPAQPTPMPAAETAIAPLPRAVSLFPSPSGWRSDWKQIGDIRIRVLGAAIRKVPLTDSRKRNSESAGEFLAIWLEIANASPTANVDYRVFQPPENEHAFLWDMEQPIKTFVSPSGTWPRWQCEYKTTIRSGESVVEVLAFETPKSTSPSVFLSLNAGRVAETGKYTFSIPATAWKRK